MLIDHLTLAQRRAAKAAWDADRAELARIDPKWQMPPWSRAPAWRKRPYLLAAKEEKHDNSSTV